MEISKRDAKDALHQVEEAHDRAKVLQSYQRGAPHFFVWGGVWIVAYIASDLVPEWTARVWWGAVGVGAACSYLIVHATRACRVKPDWRFLASVLIFVGFIQATFFVMEQGATDPRATATFPPLTVATVYAAVGLWNRLRITVAGAAIAALTLGGFVFLESNFAFFLWMAIVGGGSLILMGFWLKRP